MPQYDVIRIPPPCDTGFIFWFFSFLFSLLVSFTNSNTTTNMGVRNRLLFTTCFLVIGIIYLAVFIYRFDDSPAAAAAAAAPGDPDNWSNALRGQMTPRAIRGGKPRVGAEPTQAVRGVIYIMLGSQFQYADCYALLEQLTANLYVKYPIVMFYDNHDLINLIQKLMSTAGRNLEITPVKLDFSVPPWVPDSQVVDCPSGFTGKLGTVGYRHMCRFYSGMVFNHPALEGYDWAWRLDPGTRLFVFLLSSS